MESLKQYINTLEQAYNRLNYSLKRLAEVQANHFNDDELILICQDSVIKRFEFCFDLTWKFFKAYLEVNYSLLLASPKKIFQECFQQNILNENETRQFLDMVDDRNSTSHIYNENTAKEISQRVKSYYLIAIEILERIKSQQQ